jgi:hypothetical protein
VRPGAAREHALELGRPCSSAPRSPMRRFCRTSASSSAHGVRGSGSEVLAPGPRRRRPWPRADRRARRAQGRWSPTCAQSCGPRGASARAERGTPARMYVLVLNAGSSSLKYQLVAPASGEVALAGTIEGLGPNKTHDAAIAEVLASLGERAVGAVGHRVVHGGERFVDATAIDDEVIAAIEAHVPLAPLHNPANLAGIRGGARRAGRSVRTSPCSTRRSTCAAAARAHVRDRSGARERRRACGATAFTGRRTRYRRRLAAKASAGRSPELRHRERCTSATARARAPSRPATATETSMGMTPLEGLVMGTRCRRSRSGHRALAVALGHRRRRARA